MDKINSKAELTNNTFGKYKYFGQFRNEFFEGEGTLEDKDGITHGLFRAGILVNKQ